MTRDRKHKKQKDSRRESNETVSSRKESNETVSYPVHSKLEFLGNRFIKKNADKISVKNGFKMQSLSFQYLHSLEKVAKGWKAVVASETNVKQLYQVTIERTNTTELTGRCTCPYRSRQKLKCKHVVFTVLEVMKNKI